MATRLDKLKVNEISLVDSGANRGAVSVLMKRANGVADDAKQLFIKMAKSLGLKLEEVAQISKEDEEMKTLEEVIKQVDVLTKAKEMSDNIARLSIDLSKAKTKADVEKAAKEIEALDKNDARVGILSGNAASALKKAAHHDKYSENLGGDEKKKFEAMPMKEKDAYMAKNPVKGMSSGNDSEGNDSSPNDSSPNDSKADDVEKRLNVEINKNREMRVQLDKMEEVQAIAKINSEELKSLAKSGDMVSISKAIYDLRKVNKAQADVLVAFLKSVSAKLDEANRIISQEIGKGAPMEGSAEAKLDQLALEKSQKDGISVAKAMSLLLDTNETAKQLYKQMEDEKKASRG